MLSNTLGFFRERFSIKHSRDSSTKLIRFVGTVINFKNPSQAIYLIAVGFIGFIIFNLEIAIPNLSGFYPPVGGVCKPRGMCEGGGCSLNHNT